MTANLAGCRFSWEAIMKTRLAWLVIAACLVALLCNDPQARAGEEVSLREAFPVGYRYHVRIRVGLSGSLTVPPQKENKLSKPTTLQMRGESVIEYHERVLALTRAGQVQKTLRLCRQTDIRRTVAGRKQQQSLRPEVRRLVVVRQDNTEVPFSPDGPLTWGELDLIRTDVFTPALTGLLPGPQQRRVKVGDRWIASRSAVRELTDMERIESGSLECRLEQITTLEGRKHARVSFRGTIRGINEDGANRQKLDGYYFFDLVSDHLSYLYLRGTHSMLDEEDKEVGHLEGRFILTRQVTHDIPGLDDDTLKRLTLEPTPKNTRLLYDNPALGVRFVHPRRWKVTGERGKQVILDDSAGMGILLTLDSLPRVPSGAQFLSESTTYLRKQGARIRRVTPPRTVTTTPHLENFLIEAEMNGQNVLLDYYVTRQSKGGATLAARLPLPARRTKRTDQALAEIRQELRHLAESIQIKERGP
jgi:hypothetical protein